MHVCYCRERRGLASEVIRAAACLSLSLQPENTLLFRTALAAPLPPPSPHRRRRLSPLKPRLVGSGYRRGEKKDERKGSEERLKNSRASCNPIVSSVGSSRTG